MKTVFINCSPKKRFSASGFLLSLEKLFVRGEKVTEHLRNKQDHQRILQQLQGTDAVVFCLPLYVDGLPSHVLHFLRDMERFCLDNDLHLNLYSISNNGFIEGRQSEPLLQVLRNFCQRSGLNWCGGIGIGGGVMLNVCRIMLAVDFVLLLLNLFLNGLESGNFFSLEIIRDFLFSILLLLLLTSGVLYYLIRMGSAIGRKAFFGKKYTRVLVPSFLFILMADVFFLIISLFEGGLFRGWLAKKKP